MMVPQPPTESSPKRRMSSSIATPHLNLSGGEPIKDFHRFPHLPAELRIRVWQMAYNSIPDTLVYRFELKSSRIPIFGPDDFVIELPASAITHEAYLVPSEEVKDLTRELRSLRRVNMECRHEGERLFDNCLRLNQTKQGDTTDLHPPISLPWTGSRNFFCLVDVSEYDMPCRRTSTRFIDQIFNTVQLLGFGMDRRHRLGLYRSPSLDCELFAGFISKFTQIRHVSLVSDKLMSGDDLYDIDDDVRSSFSLSCWDDWLGRVHEDVIGTHHDNNKIVTVDDHLKALDSFVAAMLESGRFLGLDVISDIAYGMIFRTRENLDFLLWDSDLLDELFPDETLREDFSEGDEDL